MVSPGGHFPPSLPLLHLPCLPPSPADPLHVSPLLFVSYFLHQHRCILPSPADSSCSHFSELAYTPDTCPSAPHNGAEGSPDAPPPHIYHHRACAAGWFPLSKCGFNPDSLFLLFPFDPSSCYVTNNPATFRLWFSCSPFFRCFLAKFTPPLNTNIDRNFTQESWI